VSLAEFYDVLERHDWYYAMSDDHAVWTAGTLVANALAEEAKESREKAQLLIDWTRHMFSGEPWGTEKKPKPERPV
jgi:hypothetical protein